MSRNLALGSIFGSPDPGKLPCQGCSHFFSRKMCDSSVVQIKMKPGYVGGNGKEKGNPRSL